ncbi:hypothetical protein [Actinomadura alba]|uniref:Uncharacterized protein n=1 Tax=Actinomadura alba TaxID=406431 RepID=A0ABR7LLC1_9ACTN|nr:hypothetical protein [Actinomadura alba]MBC6465662.1 hypothetical protein [Actinomadura alba]
MSETHPDHSQAVPYGDGAVDEVTRLFDAFRMSTDPQPLLSDDELVAEVREKAERLSWSCPGLKDS